MSTLESLMARLWLRRMATVLIAPIALFVLLIEGLIQTKLPGRIWYIVNLTQFQETVSAAWRAR